MTVTHTLRLAPLLLLLGLAACVTAPARPATFAATLPAFTLKDPRGTTHERDALLAKGGLVLVSSAPTLASGDAQEAWNAALAAAAPPDGRWFLLEDMSQSSFPGTARGRFVHRHVTRC